MKILFLNLWHGKLQAELEQFLADQKDIDIFCFQEADTEIPKKVIGWSNELTASKLVGPKASFEQLCLFRPGFTILSQSELWQDDREMGLGLLVKLRGPKGKSFVLANIHGTSRAQKDGIFEPFDEKLDFPARLRQSKQLTACLKAEGLPAVIGGDFNLLPDTESLEMFRRAGYRDLIREYHIETTRNRYAWERYPNREQYLFSDYCFVSPELRVWSFAVPSVEISDHLPLIVEIESEL